MRKDHLRLVTDAGAALDLGWDYGIPYQMDGLSGVDVTLQTAQGVNQQGVTVEGQSVEGVAHEVIADFWGPDGERRQSYFLNIRNPGALPVPFTAKLRSSGIVVNPAIRNSVTGEHIGFDTTLNKGNVLEIYRTTTDRLAVKLISGGVETNAFALLDEDSDLMELHPGDNVLTADAASGREGLQASISFYPMVVGILPEVMK